MQNGASEERAQAKEGLKTALRQSVVDIKKCLGT